MFTAITLMVQQARRSYARTEGMGPIKKTGFLALAATFFTLVASVHGLFLLAGIGAFVTLGAGFIESLTSGLTTYELNAYVTLATALYVVQLITLGVASIVGATEGGVFNKAFVRIYDQAGFLCFATAGIMLVYPLLFVVTATQAAAIASFAPIFLVAGIACELWPAAQAGIPALLKRVYPNTA